jgi:hypothetical protein
MSGNVIIINTENLYVLKNDFYHTLISNNKLAYMIRNIFYYNNCVVDTRLILKYGIENIENGYKEVLGYPIKIRKTKEPIGSCRDRKLNECYIAEISDSDGKSMRDRFIHDKMYKREMSDGFEINSRFFPSW